MKSFPLLLPPSQHFGKKPVAFWNSREGYWTSERFIIQIEEAVEVTDIKIISKE